MFLVLDVGCGERPRGDVNCDIMVQKAPNFVLCDAHHLPFRDNAFEKVVSYYVIEHCIDIIRYLNEVYRVAKKYVVIMTDNSLWYVDLINLFLGRGARFNYEGHYCIFFPDVLERLLRKLNYNVTVKAGNFGMEAEHMKKREKLIKGIFGWLVFATIKIVSFLNRKASHTLYSPLYRDILVIIRKKV